jgi:hypothetical protein
MGVEIFEDLAPEIVDRTVALVGDNDIEGVDWDRRVVFYGRRFFESCSNPWTDRSSASSSSSWPLSME